MQIPNRYSVFWLAQPPGNEHLIAGLEIAMGLSLYPTREALLKADREHHAYQARVMALCADETGDTLSPNGLAGFVGELFASVRWLFSLKV